MQQIRGNNGPRKFVYRGAERTSEHIQAKANQSTSNFVKLHQGKYLAYKTKAGKNELRILPPTWDGIDWAYQLTVHRNVGPDNAPFLCLKMRGERCPICDERTALAREGEADAAKAIVAKPYRVAWVIDRRSQDDGPMLWFFGVQMEKTLSVNSMDDDGTPMYIDDPDNGYDISFLCENPGPQAKYSGERINRSPSPISDNQRRRQEWIDFIVDHPVPDCLQFYTAEYIDEVLHGSATRPSQEAEPIRHRATSLRDAEPDYDQQTGEYYEEDRQAQGSDEAETDTEEDGGVPFDQETEEVAQQVSRPQGFIQRPTASAKPKQTQEVVHRIRPPGQRPSSRQ